MSQDDGPIYESAKTLEGALAAVKAGAAKKWSHGHFEVSVSSSPSKNLTTGQTVSR